MERSTPTRKVVMISSTACDLPKHREQVRLACERAGFEPREMMEHLTAENAIPVDISLQMVADADVYLGIFAYRYGTVPPGHNESITEMEFNRAVELGKPCLVFFIHKDHPIVGEDVEIGAGAVKLKALKDRIGEQRVVAFFKSPEDIRSHVVEALTKLAKELDTAQTGGAVAAAAAKLHRKTSIPAPPEPYIAHPYTLLQLRDLVGRQQELNVLTDWVANPASPARAARVFCFVAIGGMGKSALAWKWFNQIAPNEMKPLAGRMWWSFYESDATFENFLTRALCYVGGQSEDEVRALPWPEREAQFLRHVDEKPYLFVLDGLERILVAYHRMDASYLADDDYDRQTANVVVGAAGLPASAAESFVGQHRLRQSTDPRAGALLQKLVQITKSRILITTRLFPWALQLPNGYQRPGCAANFLRGLSDDDALALWRALGVSGSRAELVPIFRSVEGHPLLAQALASEIANYRDAPGDFARWRADHPQFDPASLPLVQSRTHILQFALEGLSPKVREVLHTLVGFRMPASHATLEILLVGKEKACASVQEFDRALTELEDRGLIGWDREANRYDAHPIVRSVVWRLTDARDQRAVYAALEAHFESMPTPGWEEVEALSDLAPAIERYHTLIGLRRYHDAFKLFYDRLCDAALYRLAAYRESVGWLERLFPHGTTNLPALAKKSEQRRSLDLLAQCYLRSGEPGRAVLFFGRAAAAHKQESFFSQGNRGVALSVTGALRESVCALQQALLLNRRRVDSYTEGAMLNHIGHVLCVRGDHVVGHVALIRARQIFVECGDVGPEAVVSASLGDRSRWLGDMAQTSAWGDRAWELATNGGGEGDFIRAALLQGQAALGVGDFTRADERLHHALTRTRAVNVVQFELPALIAIAELELRRGFPGEARAKLDDVWEAVERGPYPLRQADAYNVLVAIALAEGDKAGAIAAATKAYTAAWCDGPPYAYHWGLEKAKAHLAALGAPKPALPPFDERKFEPLPEVEINPKDEYWVDPDKLD